MYYVYVLKIKVQGYNRFYIGYTEDLLKRLKQHHKQKQCRLIYYEAFQSKTAAQKREKRLKYYGSAWQALKKRILI
ncbi:GIY-YIG nuclease family protein [bacterium]|nr:GIY-YIG nuclease family protein [bacterium]